MAISTGWTLDYVGDNVDLPRLATLTKYWKTNPPMHVLFAQYVGFKPDTPTPVAKATQDAQLAAIIANAPKYKFVPPPAKNHGD